MTASFPDLVATTDGALVIVTTAVDGQRAGCLVGFHSQCSIEPPRYALWLSRANHTYRLALFAEHLAVHVLGAGDHELARRFGSVSDDEPHGEGADKFEGIGWTAGPDGVPLLDACPLRFVARKRSVVDDGSDHVCFVVEPTEVQGSAGGAPLRVSALGKVEPGHEATERPVPDVHAPEG